MEKSYFVVRCFCCIVAAVNLHVALGQDASTSAFRSLFTRYSNKRLSSLQTDFVSNLTLDGCTDYCATSTRFQCKSFSYDNLRRSCFLYSVNLNDPDVHLIDIDGRDHYETSYLKRFSRLPNHEVGVMVNQIITNVSPEECARRCILETRFKCRGFNFHHANQPVLCRLVESTPATGAKAAMIFAGSDFYQKETDGALSSFINYGMGMLKQTITTDVYQRFVRGISVEECAQQCLDERSFVCVSFDYVYEDDRLQSVCHLSQYIAANVQGLAVDTINPRCNHFERVERYLNYFYATPYAVIQGNNLKTFTKVTPNRCARLCMEEDAFVCRSFDYKIVPEATCLLSSKTYSDVGGLDTASGLREVIHHFEMKPLLDCGGDFTASEGGLASPNWPRSYAHHEDCVWNISVSQHKVILLRFTHFELGLQSADSCSETDDRLMVTEAGFKPYCVMPNTKTVITKTNQVMLRFKSNAQVDAQGFRAFYSAEWTCDVYLKEAPGEFASPKWPGNYPSGSRCTWRITAPDGQRVRVNFTSFALEAHTLGHCNDKFDHVRILDGGTVGSPLIGLYCGSHDRFAVRSSGRDILVQFSSDNDPHNTRQGFHARFVFEFMNGTVFDKDSRYIDIGSNNKDNEEWKGTEEEDTRIVGAQTGSEKATSDDSVSSSYRSTMWAVVTTLLFLVLVLALLLLLVVRHYRQKLSGQQEKVVGNERRMSEELVPLQSLQPSFHRNQFNNLVDLSGGHASACTAATDDNLPSASCALSSGQDDEKHPVAAGAVPAPRPPPRLHRPQSSYGKYHEDNLKNINIEDKTQV